MNRKKSMDPQSRREIILGMLEYNHIMSRGDLCAYMDISPSTLSRDLELLRRQGICIEKAPGRGLIRINPSEGGRL